MSVGSAFYAAAVAKKPPPTVGIAPWAGANVAVGVVEHLGAATLNVAVDVGHFWFSFGRFAPMADLHLRKTTPRVVVARWAAIPRHAALLSVTTQLNRKRQHAATRIGDSGLICPGLPGGWGCCSWVDGIDFWK